VSTALLQANTVKDKTKGAAEQAYNSATDFPSDAAEMAGAFPLHCLKCLYQQSKMQCCSRTPRWCYTM
jgi:hypothetical protein